MHTEGRGKNDGLIDWEKYRAEYAKRFENASVAELEKLLAEREDAQKMYEAMSGEGNSFSNQAIEEARALRDLLAAKQRGGE